VVDRESRVIEMGVEKEKISREFVFEISFKIGLMDGIPTREKGQPYISPT